MNRSETRRLKREALLSQTPTQKQPKKTPAPPPNNPPSQKTLIQNPRPPEAEERILLRQLKKKRERLRNNLIREKSNSQLGGPGFLNVKREYQNGVLVHYNYLKQFPGYLVASDHSATGRKIFAELEFANDFFVLWDEERETENGIEGFKQNVVAKTYFFILIKIIFIILMRGPKNHQNYFKFCSFLQIYYS